MGNTVGGNGNIRDYEGFISALSFLEHVMESQNDDDDEDSDSDSYTTYDSNSDNSRDGDTTVSDPDIYNDTDIFENLRSTLSSMQKKDYSNYELHYEIVNGNVRAVTDILHTTPNINLKLSTKFIEDIEVTPIHLAVKYNHFEIVKILLEKDISILNSKNIFGSTPFLMAVDNQFENIAELLLQMGADVNDTNNERCTALHFAAYKNQTKMVEFLIKNGANVNAKNYNFTTPLHFAACNGSVESVELLIKNNAKVKCHNLKHDSPLQYAAWGDAYCVAGIIRNDSNSKTEREQEITQQHKVEVMELLVDHGADLRQRDSNGDSVLHTVSRNDEGFCLAADYLVDRGFDVNCRNYSLETPLHEAALSSSTASMYVLIRNGGDMNARDDSGKTPLHNAAGFGSLSTVALLVLHGADLFALDDIEFTPHDEAEMMDNCCIARYLAQAMGDT